MMQVVLAVAAGGAAGSVLRFLTSAWVVAHWPRHYYLATLAVNLVGCFLIGLLSALFLARTDLPLALRTGLITGVLGGLTTFSSFSMEVVDMLMLERWVQALMTATAHLAGSLLMTYVGLKTAAFFIAARA